MAAPVGGEEASPLLPTKGAAEEKKGAAEKRQDAAPRGWTADGLPLGNGSVVGEPVARSQWNSSICQCLGRNDEFCSSDLEVCLLGSFAPCMLYGSNVERIGGGPGTFANHCLPYTGLYLLGNSLFGWNCLAPWFSYPSRTAIRRNFNLEGGCEAFTRSCGCCKGMIEDEEQRENCESACDFATHFFCHACSLCQEGRELRRRLPHPGFSTRSVLVMIPPTEQTMGRGMQIN
ncbi:cell number regulator 8-like [Nymphaea colorata]|uniref:cell number regulator 8-like n=1 Tax=Nymphaea colorata TaxID=210225 RepID=UPI00129DC55D|nr:cell number regulator 8-like [Nymphaea colorata]